MRKRLIQTVAVAATSLLALTACSGGGGEPSENSGSSGGKQQVVVATWGGGIQDAEIEHVFKPFEEETGIEVIVSGPPTAAQIKAMVDTGNVEWDLVEGQIADLYTLGEEYFERFPDEVLNVDGLGEQFVNPYAVGFYVFSSNIGWNTESYDEDMESWADFWDQERFPGTRTLNAGETGYPFLEAALLADGVEPEDLYPLDLDRAFVKMEELKPHVPQWWSSGSQPGQMMISGQADAAEIWSGRVFTLQEEGAPIKHSWNDGLFVTADWLVPKGAKNQEAAFKLAEYSVRPEVQARVWGAYPASPTNTKAIEMMDEEWAKTLTTHPDNIEKQFSRDYEWWGENMDEVTKRWNDFILN